MTTSTVYDRLVNQAEAIIASRQSQGEKVPTNIKQYAGRKSNWTVHLADINILPGLNFRDEDNFGDLDELRAQIIAAGGIMSAFTVIHLQGQLFAVNGHRRHEAGMAFVGTENEKYIEKVEVKLLPKDATDKDIAIRQVHDNSSETYSEWSKANAAAYYSRELGMTNVEITEVTGWPKSRVSDLLTLGTLNPNEKTFVKAQGISPASAIQAIREYRKLMKPDVERTGHVTVTKILEVALSLGAGNVSRERVKTAAATFIAQPEPQTPTEAVVASINTIPDVDDVLGDHDDVVQAETVITQPVATIEPDANLATAAEPLPAYDEMIKAIEAFDGWRSMDRSKLARVYRYINGTHTDAQPIAKSSGADLVLPTAFAG